MYNVIEIANFFIKKGIETQNYVTHMKLQKLVYFSHGWYLALKNVPLIDSSVEAWEFGPVIPTIYERVKHYGNKPILEPIHDGYGYVPELDKNETELIEFLNSIWHTYSVFDAFQLSELTHEDGSPWHTVAERYNYSIPRSKDIDDNSIKDYFENKMKSLLDVS